MVDSTAQIIALIVAIFSLILSGFMSGSEIAFFSINAQRREEMEESEKGRRALKLLDRPEQLLATLLIGNNLVNVTIVVLTNFALGPVFDGMNEILSFILQTVILTFLILLFGEILPKLIANGSPEKWAIFATPGIRTITFLFKPLSKLLVSSTSIVRRVVTKQAENIGRRPFAGLGDDRRKSRGRQRDARRHPRVWRHVGKRNHDPANRHHRHRNQRDFCRSDENRYRQRVCPIAHIRGHGGQYCRRTLLARPSALYRQDRQRF